MYLWSAQITCMKSLYLSTLVLMLLISLQSCQRSLLLTGSERVQMANYIDSLKDQTLVIRLYTNNPKRLVLQQRGLTAAVTAHDTDRMDYYRTLRSAWTAHYDFSTVLYIPDSLFAAFTAKENIPLFLDEDGNLDPDLKVSSNRHMVLTRGSRDYAFVWLDEHLQRWTPQPPVNFDRLTIWELMIGADKVLEDRIKTIDDYFTNFI